MRSGRRFWVVAVIILAMMATACGGDEDSTTDGAGSSSTTTTVDDGGSSGDDDGAQSVDGITVPLAPSADAVATSEAGELTIVQYIVPLDQQQATIAFYDEWTSSQSDDYQRTEAETGGVTWQNAPEPGGEKHLITVLSPLEGDDFIAVTVAVGPAE